MSAKRRSLSFYIGGEFLSDKGNLIKYWKFIFYVFFLVVLYISFHYSMRNIQTQISDNEKTIRTLRSEYLGKYSNLLYSSQRVEIEKNLNETGSKLVPPDEPPAIVKLKRR